MQLCVAYTNSGSLGRSGLRSSFGPSIAKLGIYPRTKTRRCLPQAWSSAPRTAVHVPRGTAVEISLNLPLALHVKIYNIINHIYHIDHIDHIDHIYIYIIYHIDHIDHIDYIIYIIYIIYILYIIYII